MLLGALANDIDIDHDGQDIADMATYFTGVAEQRRSVQQARDGRHARPAQEVPGRGQRRHAQTGRPGPRPGHGACLIPFDKPDTGLDPVRVSYLDGLARKIQEETGTTYIIITHNIPSVLRTADYIGVHFRSGLGKFAPKEDMVISDRSIIRQFLAGRAKGHIGMDELAAEQSGTERALVDPKEKRIASQGITNADHILTV